MIAHGVVADVDAHLLGEPAVVGGVRGCLPRHTELGQRAAGHAACAARQLAAQRAVIKLIHAKTPAIIQKHYDHIFFIYSVWAAVQRQNSYFANKLHGRV